MEFRPSITSIGRDRKRLIQLILVSPYIFRIRASSRFRGKLKKEKESFLGLSYNRNCFLIRWNPGQTLPSFLPSSLEKHNFIPFVPLPFLIPQAMLKASHLHAVAYFSIKLFSLLLNYLYSLFYSWFKLIFNFPRGDYLRNLFIDCSKTKGISLTISLAFINFVKNYYNYCMILF